MVCLIPLSVCPVCLVPKPSLGTQPSLKIWFTHFGPHQIYRQRDGRQVNARRDRNRRWPVAKPLASGFNVSAGLRDKAFSTGFMGLPQHPPAIFRVTYMPQ